MYQIRPGQWDTVTQARARWSWMKGRATGRCAERAGWSTDPCPRAPHPTQTPTPASPHVQPVTPGPRHATSCTVRRWEVSLPRIDSCTLGGPSQVPYTSRIQGRPLLPAYPTRSLCVRDTARLIMPPSLVESSVVRPIRSCGSPAPPLRYPKLQIPAPPAFLPFHPHTAS